MRPNVSKSAFSQPGRFAALANENVKIGRIKRWMLERNLTWRVVRCNLRTWVYLLVVKAFPVTHRPPSRENYEARIRAHRCAYTVCRALGLGHY